MSVTQLARALVALGVALTTVAVAAPAASATTSTAATTTTCRGTLAHTKVEGDVVVPGRAACQIDHVFITGSLLIQGDAAQTRVVSSEVAGVVQIGRFASFYADAVTLRDVVLTDTETASIDRATIRGSVSGTTRSLGLTHVDVGGDLTLRPGRSGFGNAAQVWFDDTSALGTVETDGFAVSAQGLTVGGDLRVLDPVRPYAHAALAGFLCTVAVDGDVHIEGARWLVGFGAHPYGDWSQCGFSPSRSTVGSLTVVGNPHSVGIGAVTVRGDLVCTGNSGRRGVVVRDDVEVRGARVGQCG